MYVAVLVPDHDVVLLPVNKYNVLMVTTESMTDKKSSSINGKIDHMSVTVLLQFFLEQSALWRTWLNAYLWVIMRTLCEDR